MVLPSAANGKQVLALPIAGMTCAACSTRLEKTLNRLPGVAARVNLATETASVEFDPAQTDLETLLAQVARTGFSVPPQTLDLQLAGMTCAACASRIEKVLNDLPGVEARVNLATERARVRYTPGRADVERLLAAVARAGYQATPYTEASRAEEKARKLADYRREVRCSPLPPCSPCPCWSRWPPWSPCRTAASGCRAGCSGCWPRRCSSGRDAASTPAPGPA
jgi:P-type Cu+ transporter